MSRQNTKDQVRYCAFEALLLLHFGVCISVNRLQDWTQFSKPDKLLHAAAGTPYEDGAFRMKMILGADFPRTPPKGMPQFHATHPRKLMC